MPKEKYDPPDPRRMYTIMSSEDVANGKKSYWAELEISGEKCQTFSELELYSVFRVTVIHMTPSGAVNYLAAQKWNGSSSVGLDMSNSSLSINLLIFLFKQLRATKNLYDHTFQNYHFCLPYH